MIWIWYNTQNCFHENIVYSTNYIQRPTLESWYTNLEKRLLRYIVSATLQDYPCAVCSSAFTSIYGSARTFQNLKIVRDTNWEVFYKSIILYKFNFSPTRNEWKRKRNIAFANIAFASWYILLKLSQIGVKNICLTFRNFLPRK